MSENKKNNEALLALIIEGIENVLYQKNLKTSLGMLKEQNRQTGF